MANDFTALGSAIYSRLSGQGTVSVYQDLAPQGAAVPYCVFGRQSAIDEYAFADGSDGLVNAMYTVRVVSNRYWPGEAQIIYGGNIHTAMQDAPLSVTGFGLLRCERTNTIQYRDSDGYWHVGGVYNVWIEPS